MKTTKTTMEIYNVSEVEISYKNRIKAADRVQVKDSKTAFNIFFQSWNHDEIEYREEFKVLLLNQANQVLGIRNVSAGGTSSVAVDMKMIFQVALKANASSIILAHNHPSGNLKPSTSDISSTKKAIKAGELLDIRVLDHVIISPNNEYVSLSDSYGYMIDFG